MRDQKDEAGEDLPVQPLCDTIFGFYQGKLEIIGDIVAPPYADEELDEFELNAANKLR